MKAVAALMACALVSTASHAQESPPEPLSPPPVVPAEPPPPEVVMPPTLSNPPLPTDEAPAPPPPLEQPGYLQRCFGVPAVLWVPGAPVVVVRGGGSSPYSSSAAPGPAGQSHSARPVGSSSGSGVSSSMDGRALVVLGVVLAAVLPIAVYVFDSDAPQVVRQRFTCPTFAFDLSGGALGFTTSSGASGTFGARFTMGYAYVGFDAELDLSNQFSQWATHLLVRPTPKKHIEGGLALGYRRFATSAGARDGFDLGLPHTYVFWREGLRQLGLEVRPSLLVGGGGIDGGVEASLVVPVLQLLHVRVGGRVFTAGAEVVWGAHAGLRLTL